MAKRTKEAPGFEAWTSEMEPVVAALLDTHLGRSKEWFPHQYVPWSLGEDFAGPLHGQPWQESQTSLTPVARAALVLGLLTEDNLPGYHHELCRRVGRHGAWGEWVHRWTAEEDRHSAAIRSYLLTTRAVDPVALERARMAHMSFVVPDDYYPGGMASMAYVLIQELSTRQFHRITAEHSGESVCQSLLARIAHDENLHMIFYRDLYKALLSRFPDTALEGLRVALKGFRMPGRDDPTLAPLALQVALGGWYDPHTHYTQVVAPLLRSLHVWELTGLGPAGEHSRERLADWASDAERRAERFAAHRPRFARSPKNGTDRPTARRPQPLSMARIVSEE
ncbi:acyl-ACP desaturase [Streptomyces sp. NPDC006627]|uniref:acyl-ACP desaturase n=1 Tax=Streptomyces sp. NPDC006627 TaxID=3154679 RepID=UPI0033BEE01D